VGRHVIVVLSLVFIVAGAGLLFLAMRHFARRRAFLRDSETTTGVIVALVESPDEEGTSYFPLVRFKPAGGSEVTFQSEMGSSKESWHVGDTLPVRHRRDRPDVAEVGSFSALWGATILFVVLGVALLSVGIGVLMEWLPVAE
jgi:hypothetical protein